MTCPSCGRQRAKRACPALGREICPTCCGTKRLAEIACPPTCVYLASARTHPPAAVVRRRERDFRFLYTVLHKLPEQAYEALGVVHDGIARYRPSAIPPLQDGDVADAAAALASTFETAARGIIYEHQPSSLPAQRLMSELRRALDAWMRAAPQSGKAERWANNYCCHMLRFFISLICPPAAAGNVPAVIDQETRRSTALCGLSPRGHDSGVENCPEPQTLRAFALLLLKIPSDPGKVRDLGNSGCIRSGDRDLMTCPTATSSLLSGDFHSVHDFHLQTCLICQSFLGQALGDAAF